MNHPIVPFQRLLGIIILLAQGVTKFIFPAQDEDAAYERPMLTMKMESLDKFKFPVVYWTGDESNISIETYKYNEGRIKTVQSRKTFL